MNNLPNIVRIGNTTPDEWREREQRQQMHGITFVHNFHLAGAKNITCLGFFPETTYIGAGDKEGNIWYWDATLLTPPKRFARLPDGVSSIAFSKTNGGILAAGSWNGTVSFFPLQDITFPRRVEQLLFSVRSIAFYPDGKHLLVGGGTMDESGLIRVSVIEQLRSAPFEANLTQVTSVAMSPDGSRAAAGTMNGRVVLFALPSGKLINEYQVEAPGAWLEHLAFSEDGSTLAAATRTDKVYLFSAEELTMKFYITMQNTESMCVDFNDSGTWLACSYKTKKKSGGVYLWRKGQETWEEGLPLARSSQSFLSSFFGKPESGVMAACFNRPLAGMGQFVAAGNREGDVSIWAVKSSFNS